MQRRTFLRTVPLGMVATALPPSFFHHLGLPLDLSAWVTQNDARVQHYLDTLEQRPEHPYFGGLPNDDGLYMPISTATMVSFSRLPLFLHLPVFISVRIWLKQCGMLRLLASNAARRRYN
ncbi:MAG: hypothetical protein HC892_10850 [Saprospiraceae bacterium]|nr:hypothetical protein [Saprospiraceae bacterium]